MDPNRTLPPPPPTNPVLRMPDGSPRPSYWLYTPEGGMTGPYLRKEARKVIRENPGVSYMACREGENWQDAKVRLPAKKASVPWGLIVMIVLLAAAIGMWWHLKQQEELRKASSPPAAQAATAPASTPAPPAAQ